MGKATPALRTADFPSVYQPWAGSGTEKGGWVGFKAFLGGEEQKQPAFHSLYKNHHGKEQPGANLGPIWGQFGFTQVSHARCARFAAAGQSTGNELRQ